MSLDIRDLNVRASNGRHILRDCSWKVDDGGRLGIIGESGSGKSITALAIMGLLPAGMIAEGSVTLNGEEILGRSEKEMQKIRGRRIAMVFQEPLTALDPLMKVKDQLTGPIRLHQHLSRQRAHEKALELLELVAIREPQRIMNSYSWEMSGGQRQRVALAMALACEPEVLIADEPTTALDVTVQAEILKLLSSVVAETGTTLVFISHDLPVIARVTEDLVVMKDGRVVEATTVMRALENPRDDYTRHLIEAAQAVNRLPVSRRGSHD